MSRRTERIPATSVTVGDQIMWPDGSSLTVETITRDGNFIDWTGTRTYYTSLGSDVHPGGVGSALFDDMVTVVR